MAEHVDCVIVGAGSTGATLAARLSENPSRHVLLLEAGPDYRSIDSPAPMRTGHWTAILDQERFPQFQWTELTAQRGPGRPHEAYWRGRGVGGSSAINGQVAIRPPIEDFREWSSGDPEGLWSPSRVVAAFARLENDLWYGAEPGHGDSGPIPISRAPLEEWGPLDVAFRDAVMAWGLPWCPDSNAPGATGISYFAYNAQNEVRVSTNDGYLEPARDRANLAIRAGHLVDRVTFDGTRATGVSVIVDGQRSEIRADEVILAAGAIHSPAILLRSGVGPAEELTELAIAVVSPLAVGRGFQEHPHVYFGFPVSASMPEPVNGRHTNACIRWSSGIDEIDNDLMGMVIGPAPSLPGHGGLGLFANRPFARGRLSLVGVDPSVDPRVEMNLAADDRDLARLRACVAASQDILASPALGELMLGAPSGIDGTPLYELRSASEIDEFIGRTVDGSAHASSTCPIGPPDSGGVVDEYGRVHGTTGLRVLDMSIAPSVPRANTNLTAIMIGELMAAAS